jgi:ribonuclease R
MLRTADELRDLLERRRAARGSIDFDLPEPKILLDVEGAMTGIAIEPRNRAHRMIEEFMLVANEAVAGYLDRERAPCLYRIHEAPDPLKVEALAEFASMFGLSLSADPEAVKPRDIRRLVEASEGRPEQALVSQVALRSMKQARYSAENVGHFGLASAVYAHFTSPIRRYPDLTLHRMLRAFRRSDAGHLAALADGLPELADDCSKRERDAEAAERELLEWKKVAFMKGKEGQAFDGIVTGVARFGLFVQISETLAEGLLRVERLGDEHFEYQERRMELLGERSGASFRLGDPIRVVVDRVDPVLRRLDLSISPGSAAGAGRAGIRPREAGASPGARGKGAGRRPREGRAGGRRRR